MSDDNYDEMFEGNPVKLTPQQLEEMQELASQFNLTIQAAFLELMEKMQSVEIDHPGGHVIKGNYAPMALGAAIAAIVERYDPSCEQEFWVLTMNKYKEARKALAGILEQEEEEKEGVTTVEVDNFPNNLSKMKH